MKMCSIAKTENAAPKYEANVAIALFRRDPISTKTEKANAKVIFTGVNQASRTESGMAGSFEACVVLCSPRFDVHRSGVVVSDVQYYSPTLLFRSLVC